jgi:hypothetical protein
MAENDNKSNDDARRAWYRIYDVKTGRVAMIGIVGIILLVIAMYLTNQYFLATTHKQIDDVLLMPPSAELEALQAREDSLLNSYRLIDSTQGVYQIPIDKAMEMLADSAENIKPASGREY